MKFDGMVEYDIDVIGMNCKLKDWYMLEEMIFFIFVDIINDVIEWYFCFCFGIYDIIVVVLKEIED